MKRYGKAFSFFVLILFAGNAYAQSGKNALSLKLTPSFGYRILTTDDKGNFQSRGIATSPEQFKKVLDSSESGIFTYSFSLNFLRRLNAHLSASAGIGLLKMGKKRTMFAAPSFYESSDGTYIPVYTGGTIALNSHINYISLPIAINYNLALREKIDLITGGGIIPMYSFSSSNPVSIYVSSTHPDNYQTKTITVPVNRFVLAAELALGFSYKWNEKLEFQLSPHYLQQLTPGVTYWEDLKQYNYNLGLEIGAKVNL